MYPCLTITRKYVKTIEPPCTERYARWCGRSAAQLMSSLLPDAWARLLENLLKYDLPKRT